MVWTKRSAVANTRCLVKVPTAPWSQLKSWETCWLKLGVMCSKCLQGVLRQGTCHLVPNPHQ